MRWHLLPCLGKLLFNIAQLLSASDYKEHYRRDLGPATLQPSGQGQCSPSPCPWPPPVLLHSDAAQLIGPLPPLPAVPHRSVTSDIGCFYFRAPGHNAAGQCVASSTHPQSPTQPPPGPAPDRPTAPAGHQATALRTAHLQCTGAVHSAERNQRSLQPHSVSGCHVSRC